MSINLVCVYYVCVCIENVYVCAVYVYVYVHVCVCENMLHGWYVYFGHLGCHGVCQTA